MPARLEPLEGGADIPLNRPLTLVGRHSDCDVRLESVRVSRHHCCLAAMCDGVAVRDLSSTNGTKINGRRITEGWLRLGDELTIGRFHFRCHLSIGPSGSAGSGPDTELWQPQRTPLPDRPSRECPGGARVSEEA
jgi:pSer/pThr/pTyr-binding forkhead associated (FHA) protein